MEHEERLKKLLKKIIPNIRWAEEEICNIRDSFDDIDIDINPGLRNVMNYYYFDGFRDGLKLALRYLELRDGKEQPWYKEAILEIEGK